MFRNSVSSEAPRTISGVDSGRKTIRFVAPSPTKWWRTIASAMSVPSTVATRVASVASSSEVSIALWIPRTEFQWIQLSKVNVFQT